MLFHRLSTTQYMAIADINEPRPTPTSKTKPVYQLEQKKQNQNPGQAQWARRRKTLNFVIWNPLRTPKADGPPYAGLSSADILKEGGGPKPYLLGTSEALRCVVRSLALAMFALGVSGKVGAATVTVEVAPQKSFSFRPNPVFIQPGDTVRWAWKSTGHFHTVTSGPFTPGTGGTPDGLFDSGAQMSTTFVFPTLFPPLGSSPIFASSTTQSG